MQIESVLVDARNFDEVRDEIIAAMQKASFVGLDCETDDYQRHAGLTKFSGYKPDGSRSKTKKLVFDFRRIEMCGFSVYPENSSRAYYVNLFHSDVENRLNWEQVKPILDALPEKAHYLCHNAAFEMTVFRSRFRYELPRVICTMQLAVSAFGPDEYSKSDFLAAGQGGIKDLIPELVRESAGFLGPNDISNSLQEVLTKVLAKQSDAAHSYNGFVKELSYSYGLKKLAKHFLNYEMTTFDQVMGNKNGMRELSGDEVVSYGADDAWVVVPLFHKLLEYASLNCPGAIQAFFETENPMVGVYSQLQTGGLRVNHDAIFSRQASERAHNAQVLRDLKAVIRQMLPFPDAPHRQLTERDSWYAKGHAKYRKLIETWANTPDSEDDFTQNQQVRGAVSNAWAVDMGVPESTGPNISHYMPQRVMLYDLTGTKLIISHGKTQSDGEARGKLKDRFQKDGNHLAVKMIDHINSLASVDQRLKLFVTPYTQLVDPETNRLYPTVTSMLATRRMAASNPNPLQLSKRGDSTYVRGFFEADHDDHVMISCDWSALELVLIGEASGDPEFIKAFGQRPYEDLHSGAAAAVLSIPSPGLTEEIFNELKTERSEEAFRERHKHNVQNLDRIFTNLKGEPLPIEVAHKFWRTELGKGSNFSMWFSGMLNTIGDKMGWDFDTMMAATNAYKERFAVAEEWRLGIINEARLNGMITLPDGHTRTRYEATDLWKQQFTSKFQLPNPDGSELISRYNALWQFIAGKIQRRAWNQSVNARIQGFAAHLAKRSILNLNEAFRERGWTDREARFILCVHDEIVCSVHKDIAVEAVHVIRDTMMHHPTLFKHCVLDASPSIGRTFEPYGSKAPFGQIEIAEAPNLHFVPETEKGGWMSNDTIQATVDYLMATHD